MNNQLPKIFPNETGFEYELLSTTTKKNNYKTYFIKRIQQDNYITF